MNDDIFGGKSHDWRQIYIEGSVFPAVQGSICNNLHLRIPLSLGIKPKSDVISSHLSLGVFEVPDLLNLPTTSSDETFSPFSCKKSREYPDRYVTQ